MGGKKSNHVRRLLRSFGAVQNWQLLLILIPLLFVTATLLRLDHLRMAELRDAVISADNLGDDELLQEKLQALQEFTFKHVVVNIIERNGTQNLTFGTGPFYLEGQYLRAANEAIAEAESQLANDSNPNGNIYAAVSAICRPLALANGWAWNSPGYLNCWTSELDKYPAAEELNSQLTANVPSTELFRYDYASPIWAPSWAGWAILACIIILAIIIIRLVIWCVLHIFLLFLGKN
jgi:hypothetical protein